MVHIKDVRSSNVALVKSQPLVAVFSGGTSGIGKSTILSLAATHATQGQGLRLYLVGRNEDAAKSIIAECLRLCPGGQFRFVKAQDLTLLSDVDKACAEIKRMEQEENQVAGGARVDLLVMSQGLLNFDGRTETREGLDRDMSLLYYSRMRFIVQLLPLLLASPTPAHVVSVYAAGMEDKLFPEDLSLRNPNHYSFANKRSHVVYMTTLFLEGLANRHAGRLSLVHVYPSLVIHDAMTKARVPSWFKVLWQWFLAPVLRPFTVSPTESGERTLSFASSRYPAQRRESITADPDEAAPVAMGSDGNQGSGAYALNWDGEPISTKKMHNAYQSLREGPLPENVWNHTMKAFETIEAGGVFDA